MSASWFSLHYVTDMANGIDSANLGETAATLRLIKQWAGSRFPDDRSRYLAIMAVCIVTVILFQTYVSYNPDRDAQQSIKRALNEHDGARFALDIQTKGGRVSKELVSWYASRLQTIDTSECPPDFQEAYKKHSQGWQGLANQLKSEPDGFAEAFLMGALKALEGDPSGGVNEIRRSRSYFDSAIRDTWADVKVTALRHGVRYPATSNLR